MISLYKSGRGSDMTISCQGEVFNVHRAIVCSQSTTLAQVHGLWEGERATYRDDVNSPKAVDRMIEFLYKQEYSDPVIKDPVTQALQETSIHSSQIWMDAKSTTIEQHVSPAYRAWSSLQDADEGTRVESCPSLEYDDNDNDGDGDGDSDDNKNIHPTNAALLVHVDMHNIADFYGIPALKEKANEKFQSVVATHEWQMEGFVDVVTTVFSGPKSEDACLRRLVTDLVRENILLLTFDDRFQKVIDSSDSVGELCYGVFQRMNADLMKKQGEISTMKEAHSKEVKQLHQDLQIAQTEIELQESMRKTAENELQNVIEIFYNLKVCRNSNCDRTIDVLVERGGKHRNGSYLVRCGRCRTRHT